MIALVRRFVPRRHFLRQASALAALVAVGGAFPLRARSQGAHSGRARHIGVLGVARSLWFDSGFDRTFKSELARLGWQEGKDLTIEYRFVENDYARAAPLAQELIDAGAEVLVVSAGATGVAAAKRRMSGVPIVMFNARDPVKFGLVSSLSRPGGNVTGMAWPSIDWGKYLELGRELVGERAPIGVIANPTNTVYANYIAQNEAAARRLGIKLQSYPAATVVEIGKAFAAMAGKGVSLAVVGPDAIYLYGEYARHLCGGLEIPPCHHRRQQGGRRRLRRSVSHARLRLHRAPRAVVRRSDPPRRQAGGPACRAARQIPVGP